MSWEALVGIGGLLVASMTTYLAYRERRETRTSKYREELYSKQIESVTDLMSSLVEYLHLLLILLEDPGFSAVGLQADTRTLTKAKEANINLLERFDRSIVLLPSDLIDSINSFGKMAFSVLASAEANAAADANPDFEELRKQVRRQYTGVVVAARKALGTEQLSQEALMLIGNSVDPLQVRHRDKYKS